MVPDFLKDHEFDEFSTPLPGDYLGKTATTTLDKKLRWEIQVSGPSKATNDSFLDSLYNNPQQNKG